ncbi:kinase-like protein [Rhizophagus irregularis]|uniref:Kinase-like protein n=1 Tax=Rhizophagus irregularis TaxID=588596 RepID=A0A2I1G870_9GLOM|nr:kinase-like protein [Rhizophagus irregularis]
MDKDNKDSKDNKDNKDNKDDKVKKDKVWLEAQIEANSIKSFNNAEFSNIVRVGEGGFGNVYKAYWKSRRMTVALKSLKAIPDETTREFVRELRLLRNVFYHPRINQFLGITKDSKSNYVMVLQYADGGNLRDYIRKSVNPLTWPEKYRIALEIAEGLLCLHAEGILHRDLHPKNVLVHKGNMLIADFGLSKEESSTSSNSSVKGTPAYIDPQCHIQDKYKRSKKSDIFSFGMILWELSSEREPFAGEKDFQVVLKISRGIREKMVEGTPESYFRLYTECWNQEPEERPKIEDVVEILESIIRNSTDDYSSNPSNPSNLSNNLLVPPVPINTSTYTCSLNTGEMNSEIKEEIYKHYPLYVNHNSYSIGTSGSLYMDEDV